MLFTPFTRRGWIIFIPCVILFIAGVWLLPLLWAPKEVAPPVTMAMKSHPSGGVIADSIPPQPFRHPSAMMPEGARMPGERHQPYKRDAGFPYQAVLTTISLLLAILKGATDLIKSLKSKT